MDFFKSINMNSGRAIYNFAQAISANTALPLGRLFITRPSLFFRAGAGYRPHAMPRPGYPTYFLHLHIPLIFARKQLKMSEICTLFQPIKLQIFCILTIMSVNQWAPRSWRVLFWSCNMYIFFLYVVHWRWIIIFVNIFMTYHCCDKPVLKFKIMLVHKD